MLRIVLRWYYSRSLCKLLWLDPALKKALILLISPRITIRVHSDGHTEARVTDLFATGGKNEFEATFKNTSFEWTAF